MRFAHVRCLGTAVALGILFASPEVWQRARTLIDLSAFVEPCNTTAKIAAPTEKAFARYRIVERIVSIPRNEYWIKLRSDSDKPSDTPAITCDRCLDLSNTLKKLQALPHCNVFVNMHRKHYSGDEVYRQYLGAKDEGTLFKNTDELPKQATSDDHFFFLAATSSRSEEGIHLEVQVVVRHLSRLGPGIGWPENYERAPISKLKMTQTIARGDTLVFSGMRQQANRVRKLEVPLLSKLPRFGAHFTYEREVLVDEDVLYFFTLE
jgi:hypothetical protein